MASPTGHLSHAMKVDLQIEWLLSVSAMQLAPTDSLVICSRRPLSLIGKGSWGSCETSPGILRQFLPAVFGRNGRSGMQAGFQHLLVTGTVV